MRVMIHEITYQTYKFQKKSLPKTIQTQDSNCALRYQLFSTFSTSIKPSRHPSRQCTKETAAQPLPSLPTVSSSSKNSNNDSEKNKKKKKKKMWNNNNSSSKCSIVSDDSGE